MVKGWTGFVMQGFLKQFAKKTPQEKFSLIGMLKQASIARAVMGLFPKKHEDDLEIEKEKPNLYEVCRPRVRGWGEFSLNDVEVKKVTGMNFTSEIVVTYFLRWFDEPFGPCEHSKQTQPPTGRASSRACPTFRVRKRKRY